MCVFRATLTFWAAFAFALPGCSTQKPASGPDPTTLHKSCLQACRGVRKLPACTSAARAEPVSSLGRILSDPSGYDGRLVRVSGRLKNGAGAWTLAECRGSKCCNEQAHAFVSLEDPKTLDKAELAGNLRLPSGATSRLVCRARDGYMVQEYAPWEERSPLVFERWDRQRYGDPLSEQLIEAYCCSIDVREQTVIAEGTLKIAERAFDNHRLIDPSLCEVRQ